MYIAIDQVLVTYIKPALGFEPEGFFVQNDLYGPAMFVSVSPSFSGVRLTAGDRVSFRVYEMGGLYENSVALAVGELVVHSRGNDVSALVQDVNEARDLTNSVYSYTAELVRARVTVQDVLNEDGFGSATGWVGTEGIDDDRLLNLRLPSSLQRLVGLEPNCTLELDGVPLWRQAEGTVFLAYDMGELRDVSCPQSRVQNIVYDTATELRIELSRSLDPSTVQANGSQFTLDGGVTVTAAAVDGRFVTLTITPLTAGQFYVLDMATSLRDILGVALQVGGVGFSAPTPRARVRINELKANIVPSCDLLELRVTEGGTLNDVRITEKGATIYTFRNLQVETNDIVVIHFNGFSTQCNPGRSPNETQAASQHPRVVFGANFDTAYDIYLSAVGLETTPHTIGAHDYLGRLLDIVLVTGSLAFAPDTESEDEAALAAEAGEWRTQNGSVPSGGFRGDTFSAHAAEGLHVGEVSIVTGWSALDGQPSVQRSSNADSNHRGDWTTAPHSFGLLNAGQSPL